MSQRISSEPKLALRQARSVARAIKMRWAKEAQFGGGEHVISQKGEGIQWADIRPYTYGDEVKWISWKHSCRSPETTWIKTFELERAHRVVFLLDNSLSLSGGFAQKRFLSAWWLTSVFAHIVMQQHDVCMVYTEQSHQPISLMRDEIRYAKWAMGQHLSDSQSYTPLHVKLQKVCQSLKRHASILIFTDGHDDFTALHSVLKQVSKNHEVRLVLFPDLIQDSPSFAKELSRFGWRWPLTHEKKGALRWASLKKQTESWQHFWKNIRLPQVTISYCHPQDDLVFFARKLLKAS